MHVPSMSVSAVRSASVTVSCQYVLTVSQPSPWDRQCGNFSRLYPAIERDAAVFRAASCCFAVAAFSGELLAFLSEEEPVAGWTQPPTRAAVTRSAIPRVREDTPQACA